MLLKFLNEHKTIASVLTIIVSMIVITQWMTADIRENGKETNKRIDALSRDIRDTNKRIDGLFQFVLTK